MTRGFLRGVWRLAYAFLFYPAVFALMIWLTVTKQHWMWGVCVITAVLVVDPIYRIILRSVLNWRPAKK